MGFLLLYFLIFYFGASLASGLFLCAERITHQQSIIRPRSHCIACQHPLSWWQLLPVVSYPLLGGRCYYCHIQIALTTWSAEIIGGSLALFSWYVAPTKMALINLSLLFIGLFLFSWIDIQQRVLYPSLFIPWLFSLLVLRGNSVHYQAALVILCGLGLFAYYSHGLGSGDVELLTGLTLLYGFNATNHILIHACLLALLSYPLLRQRQLPFIPYLSLGVWLYFGEIYLIGWL
ncbi:prepilin peptidase [Loigolactobacillus zhaoyuanensis]|uniref:A24 family peptidase n=1 Tax=Loigolactobacillus zhaoyuanensis TaxID=2486017 RepID=A0ABW8UBY3_9LACO